MTVEPIYFRRDTAADWAADNPTLSPGEPGFEKDTGKLKIGGQNPVAWNALPYFGGASSLTVGAVTTTAGALVLAQHTPVDATSASKTMTLPTGMAQGSVVSVEKYDASTNAVVVSGSIRGATATISLGLAHETVELVSDSAGSWWPFAGHKTLSSLDARYVVTYQPTAVKAAAYVAFPFDDVLCDTHSGGWVGTLPAAVVGARLRWTNVATATTTTNSVVLVAAGTDTINLPANDLPPTVLPGESVECRCFVTGLWSLI